MTAAGKSAPWEQLFQYWLSRNIDGHPPARADLDPMIDIPQLAPHLIILDIVPGGYRYRLAGSDLASRLGEELTGTLVGRKTAAESKWFDLLDIVRQEQKPLIITSETTPPSMKKRLGVVLPLVDRSGMTEQILGGIFFGSDFRPGMRVGTLAVQDLMAK